MNILTKRATGLPPGVLASAQRVRFTARQGDATGKRSTAPLCIHARRTESLPAIVSHMKPPATLSLLHASVIACERCPRLREYCVGVGREKRRAFAEWTYWTRPVPGFGDSTARLWIIGLAPAAHGANRTGRVFTGDNSGNFLFAALHRTGFANQPNAVSRDDGLQLTNCYISATARCAPPDNKPAPDEIAQCAGFLDAEWSLLESKRVILALGKIAWDAALALAARQGSKVAKPRPAFGHGAEIELAPCLHLLGSYHVSQQNTFTGKLTPAMFDAVLHRAKQLSLEYSA
jgi:uracil-DNA glycosylase family 4